MWSWKALSLMALLAASLLSAAGAGSSPRLPAAAVAREDYLPEPIPSGFQVAINELEGPVFVDQSGQTLYTWPLHGLRNGDVGDRKNVASSCTSEVDSV